jgi:hypothetical protein
LRRRVRSRSGAQQAACPRANRRTSECSCAVDAELGKKGHFNESNQYRFWYVYRAPDDPAGPLDAQAETTDRWGSITKDVPLLRIDHVTIKGKLLGVWQALYSGGVLNFKEVI